jgi:chromosome segregation ATPase
VSSGRRPLEDRELDAILERLDRLTEAVERVGRRLDALEGIDRMSRDFQNLSRSLESLAYAALGARGPNIRRPNE